MHSQSLMSPNAAFDPIEQAVTVQVVLLTVSVEQKSGAAVHPVGLEYGRVVQKELVEGVQSVTFSTHSCRLRYTQHDKAER